MTLWLHRIARLVIALVLTAAMGGLITAALVRTSPGFDTDERLLDPRLSAESRSHAIAEHDAGRNVWRFYARHINGMLHGDLGNSPSLNQPIAGLIASRLPVTLEIMALGIGGGWAIALFLSLPAVMLRGGVCSRLAGALSTCFLCVPSAALAVLIFSFNGPVPVIVALALFPRLFEYLRSLFQDAYSRPHIVTARVKGLRPARILVFHVIPVCAPEMLALAGVSVAMAFGAAIPVETLCDLPGIGQLAWKSAMARDLPVLVTLTMFIAILTQLCNAISDWATPALGRTE